MEYSDSILMPKTYDIVWSLIPLVVILFYWALITVIERKRGSSWLTVILWCLLALVVPIAGFFIWLIFVARSYPASPTGTASRTGESTTE